MDHWWSGWGVREATSCVRVGRALFQGETELCDREENPKSGRADVPEACHEEKRWGDQVPGVRRLDRPSAEGRKLG